MNNCNLLWIDLYLTDHCNKKCAFCSTYSPIAEPWEYPIDKLKNDINHLISLCKDGPFFGLNLDITGGEPALHSKLKEVKNIIDDPRLRISWWTTEKLDDDFVKSFKTQQILYYREIESNNTPKYVNIYNYKFSTLHKVRLFKYKQKEHSHCYSFSNPKYKKSDYYERRLTLRDGKLYHCGYATNCFKLEKKYGVKFELIEGKDYLILQDIQNIKEIMDFFESEPPFCGYCMKEDYSRHHQKEPEESDWIVE